MNDLNYCSFIGRLGKDPEIRYMPNGEAVCGFSLAIGSQWTSKSGEKQESTEWVNISAFGKLAEICGQYLVKGSKVFVSGRLKTDKYTDKSGVEKYATRIMADKMQMLDGKNAADNQNQKDQPVKTERSSQTFEDMDDDIQF